MMGLSLLTKIIDMDSNLNWINFISSKGYISCIINTITNTDNQILEECFHTQIRNHKIIYVFETKIALLVSISKSNLGSQVLLKNGLVNALNACTVFSIRTKFDRYCFTF